MLASCVPILPIGNDSAYQTGSLDSDKVLGVPALPMSLARVEEAFLPLVSSREVEAPLSSNEGLTKLLSAPTQR